MFLCVPYSLESTCRTIQLLLGYPGIVKRIESSCLTLHSDRYEIGGNIDIGSTIVDVVDNVSSCVQPVLVPLSRDAQLCSQTISFMILIDV